MRSAALVFLLASAACLVHARETTTPVEKTRVETALPAGSVPFDELGKDIQGSKIRISDYRGKVVILSFWASWCGPCKKELPVLAGVVKRVGPDQLQVIAVNFHDEPKPFKYVADVLKDFPITILRDQNGRTANKYEVRAIPRMIVIGRDGKVAADHTGYGEGMIPELIDQLNALLAKGDSAN